MIRIGIDIGGTAIKMGAVSREGNVLHRVTHPFAQSLAFEGILEILAEGCAEIRAAVDGPVSCVGICSPGYIDPGNGVLVDGGANVAALRERPLSQLTARRLGLAVHWVNDGVAAAIGEARHGAGRAFRRFVMLTLGTGVGGCVVIEDEACVGAAGQPPELGAIVIADGGTSHANGRPGSLESFASSAGFLARYHERGGDLAIGDTASLFARLGTDPLAAEAIDLTARSIAQAVGGLVNALALDGCVVGGGVGSAGAALTSRIEAHLPDFTWPLLARSLTIVPAACGNDAGLVGAAALATDVTDLLRGRHPAE